MANLLTIVSTLKCPHGGSVGATPFSTRARAGDPILRASDAFTITRCGYSPGFAHPCVTVQWVQPAKRVKHAGDFVLNAASVGLCLAGDGIPQGTVMVWSTQSRVAGL